MQKRNVYIAYSSYSTVSREPDPDDAWDRGCYDEHLEVHGATWSPPKTPYVDVETVELQDNQKTPRAVHAVLIRYTDGDTFGSTSGYHEWGGLYTSLKKAKEVADHIRTYGDYPREDTFSGKWVVWRGYFAKLDSVEVCTLKVNQ